MTWGELLHSVPVAAAIFGAILGGVTWALNRRTHRLIREMRADTERTLGQMQATQGQMDARAADCRLTARAVLHAIDARAEERHRETRG